MELLISGIVSIIIMEAYAWLPRLSDKLLDRAISRLRKRDQDRCREEWLSGLEILPNTFAKLFHAVVILRRARRIGHYSFRSELRMLDEEIRAVTEQHIYLVELFGQARVQLNCSGRKLAGVLDELCKSNMDFSKETTRNGVSVLKPGETIAAFSRDIFSAYTRAMQNKLLRIESCHEKLQDIKCMIEEASAKLDATSRELRRGASLDQLDQLLGEIATELLEVRSILEDEEWGEDKAIGDSYQVCKAVGCRPEWCRHSPPRAFQRSRAPARDQGEKVSEAAD